MSRRPPPSLLLALVLAGCSLMTGTHESLTVYSPQPRIAETAREAAAWQLIVAEPQALAPLGGDRIVVMPQPGVVEFYKGVRWRDRATLILQDLLVQAQRSAGSPAAISQPDSGVRGDFLLRTDLRAFQAEYRSASTPTVVVRIDAQLVDNAARRIVAVRSVAVERACPSAAIPAVFAAFEQALAEAIAEVVEWTRQAGDAAWSEGRAAAPAKPR